jgi:hypothetical protein
MLEHKTLYPVFSSEALLSCNGFAFTSTHTEDWPQARSAMLTVFARLTLRCPLLFVYIFCSKLSPNNLLTSVTGLWITLYVCHVPHYFVNAFWRIVPSEEFSETYWQLLMEHWVGCEVPPHDGTAAIFRNAVFNSTVKGKYPPIRTSLFSYSLLYFNSHFWWQI